MGTPLQRDETDPAGGVLSRPFDPAAGQKPSPPRLTPAMSSRKLQALQFIKDYLGAWGQGPSLSELAGHLGISKKRAHELVDQLDREEKIERIRGKARSIRLPDRAEELSEAEVLRRLQALGWTIGTGDLVLQPPGTVAVTGAPLTKNGLPGLPQLYHEGPDEVGGDGT